MSKWYVQFKAAFLSCICVVKVLKSIRMVVVISCITLYRFHLSFKEVRQLSVHIRKLRVRVNSNLSRLVD